MRTWSGAQLGSQPTKLPAVSGQVHLHWTVCHAGASVWPQVLTFPSSWPKMTDVFGVKVCGFWDSTTQCSHRKIWEAPNLSPFDRLGPDWDTRIVASSVSWWCCGRDISNPEEEMVLFEGGGWNTRRERNLTWTQRVQSMLWLCCLETKSCPPLLRPPAL